MRIGDREYKPGGGFARRCQACNATTSKDWCQKCDSIDIAVTRPIANPLRLVNGPVKKWRVASYKGDLHGRSTLYLRVAGHPNDGDEIGTMILGGTEELRGYYLTLVKGGSTLGPHPIAISALLAALERIGLRAVADQVRAIEDEDDEDGPEVEDTLANLGIKL